jgi:hypothetical protein
MFQTSRVLTHSALRRFKALPCVKTLYAVAFVVLLASGMLLAFPLTTTFAANCSADCGTGEVINITGAATCS